MIFSAFSAQNSSIEVGAIYQRNGVGSSIEMAQVIEIAPDKMGIPHVRFDLSVQRGAETASFETRTLSLEAFLSRFRQRIRD